MVTNILKTDLQTQDFRFSQSGCWLSGSPIIQIVLALQVNLSRILQN